MDEGREVIGRGRTAEILAWGDGRAMKLYVEGSSREYVAREALVSRVVARLGLPAPAVYDAPTPDGLYDIGGRLGILYERVDGPTMMRDVGGSRLHLLDDLPGDLAESVSSRGFGIGR